MAQTCPIIALSPRQLLSILRNQNSNHWPQNFQPEVVPPSVSNQTGMEKGQLLHHSYQNLHHYITAVTRLVDREWKVSELSLDKFPTTANEN